MNHIDIHCHTNLKSFIAKDSSLNAWTNFIVKPKLFFDVLSSQSSFDQMRDGHVKLAVLVMGGLEREILAQGLTRFVAKVSGQYNLPLLRSIIDGDISYFDLLKKQMDHLLQTKDIKVINHADEIEPDSEQIQVIFCIEGGYNFYGDPKSSEEMNERTVIENLKKIKHQKTPRILYITLTHLLQSALCTHAYGMKIIQNQVAFPEGSGLTALGEKFIKTVMDEKEGYPILIDIKHMSLKSRLEFFELRRKHFPDTPILASHMGVTGTSYKKLPITTFQHLVEERKVWVKYKVKSGIAGTNFNPWSINLYDEEIVEILKSNGLIGISLDQRILGFGISRKEFFSVEEFFSTYIHHIDDHPSSGLHSTFKGVQEILSLSDQQQIHLNYLCNNILHIVKVGYERIGEEVWNHICLGSDNDGIIKAITSCESSACFPELRKGLERTLFQLAEMDNIPVDNIKDKVEKIMFENSYRFIRKHFR